MRMESCLYIVYLSVLFRTSMRSMATLCVTVASADLERVYRLDSVSLSKEWRDEEIWLGEIRFWQLC